MLNRGSNLIACIGAYAVLITAAAPVAMPVFAESGMIEEVVVTARKRQESMQDVPVAIQAMNNAKIERYDASSLSEIADMANNVQIKGGASGNGGSYIIRGYGSVGADSGIEQSVATNIDGVQTTRGFVARTSFFDMQSVEILKGPQALFFGKNSPGGVIGVKTAMPTDVLEAKMQVGYETGTDESLVDAMVSGPLSDTVRARLAFRYTDQGGWIDNNAMFVENSNREVWPEPYDLPGARGDILALESTALRATLDWTPTDALQVTTRVMYANEKSDGTNSGELVSCTAPPHAQLFFFRPPPLGPLVVTDPFQDCKGDHETSVSAPPPEITSNFSAELARDQFYTDFDIVTGSVNLAYETEWMTITSVTGYLDYDYNGFDTYGGMVYPVFMGLQVDRHEQWSQEIRLASELPTPVNFMVGAYFDTFERDHVSASKLSLFGPDPITGYANDVHTVQYTEGDSWSAFAQVMWDITDDLELSAGGRYSKDEKQGEQQNTYIHLFFQAAGFLLPQGRVVDAEFEDDNFSPEVTLTWRPTSNITLWGAWKTGFKSGGYSTPGILGSQATSENTIFRPEEADGFEVGLKSTLLDGRLRFNVTAYDYSFEDLQVTVFDPETTSFYISNAASSSTSGFEIDTLYQVNANLALYAEAGYNKAEFDTYLGECYQGQPVGPTECVGGAYQDLSGAPLSSAPEWSGSVGFEYVANVSDNWLLILASEAIFVDEYIPANNAVPSAVVDSVLRLRARLGLESQDGRWNFAVVGKNLTNEIYPDANAPRPGALTGLDQLMGYGAGSLPRTVQFRATYRI